MQQAVYLLINSRIAVSDIIEAVGYDNTSYFIENLKNATESVRKDTGLKT